MSERARGGRGIRGPPCEHLGAAEGLLYVVVGAGSEPLPAHSRLGLTLTNPHKTARDMKAGSQALPRLLRSRRHGPKRQQAGRRRRRIRQDRLGSAAPESRKQAGRRPVTCRMFSSPLLSSPLSLSLPPSLPPRHLQDVLLVRVGRHLPRHRPPPSPTPAPTPKRSRAGRYENAQAGTQGGR